MKRFLLISVVSFMPCAAFAQAPAPQPSPSQMALQLNAVIGQWAQVIEADGKTIADLRKQITDLQKQLEAAKQSAKDPAK